MMQVGARALELAQELVRVRTTGGDEAPAVELCEEVLAGAGWEVERIPYGPGRPQLLARTGPGELERCLCGHLDTVGISEGSWTVDPFEGVVSEGYLWGRGAADMKGGVGAILAAAESVGPDERHLGAAILLTAAEETGAEGAAELAGREDLATISEWLVAEPTGNRVLVGHRGALWLRVRALGRAGHASAPPPGGGSIGELRRALDRLDQLDLGSDPDAPTIAVTGLVAGSAPNVLPSEALGVLDARFASAAAGRELKRAIAEALGEEVSLETLAAMPAVTGSATSALATEACALSATSVEEHPATYFTDLSMLAGSNAATVILGPGEPEQAHAVDERCRVDAIAAAADIYAGLLAR
ncbi:MAG: succinyl-diaminopimelate desuccinylase [Thermoleophilaceae bacterium]|jgi:succinyl-diaminopimelate desuccinylase|nr:succinyl-diaminopimelate desuccinylase [Thermoleophilaceae bacterium]